MHQATDARKSSKPVAGSGIEPSIESIEFALPSVNEFEPVSVRVPFVRVW
jgi:hypothetical protein